MDLEPIGHARLDRDTGTKRGFAGIFPERRVSADRSRNLVSPLVLTVYGRRNMNYRIPFNRPTLIPEAMSCVSEVIRSGRLSGNGPCTHGCEARLREITGGLPT